PNLWHPRKDNYFQIDEMPALGTGKLDLKQLKTIAQERVASKHLTPSRKKQGVATTEEEQ
ncbi:MAG: hypothetical protein DRQ44_15030, partial [Gammaproteobacteria bacterium]